MSGVFSKLGINTIEAWKHLEREQPFTDLLTNVVWFGKGFTHVNTCVCFIVFLYNYVCRLCINYQDLRTNLLVMAALRFLLLTFISRFVIDFLSI